MIPCFPMLKRKHDEEIKVSCFHEEKYVPWSLGPGTAQVGLRFQKKRMVSASCGVYSYSWRCLAWNSVSSCMKGDINGCIWRVCSTGVLFQQCFSLLLIPSSCAMNSNCPACFCKPGVRHLNHSKVNCHRVEIDHGITVLQPSSWCLGIHACFRACHLLHICA